MGKVNFGAPLKEVEWLKTEMQCSTFVEGGTFRGETANAMSSIFENVVTIEGQVELHQAAQKRFPKPNISYLLGDTRKHLKEILDENTACILWLDAHWCGEGTFGKSDECPLLDELDIVFSSSCNTAILVDDARLFLSPPPLPHKISEWPSLDQIIRAIPADWGVTVYEDVIYILDNRYFSNFQKYLQSEYDNSKQTLQETKKTSRLWPFKDRVER